MSGEIATEMREFNIIRARQRAHIAKDGDVTYSYVIVKRMIHPRKAVRRQ